MGATAHYNPVTGKMEYYGGSIPIDDTDTSDEKTWSSEKIDSEISAVDQKVQISNPNLLDNPWFTVNQRGVSSYQTEGSTLDRWILTNDGSALTVTSTGIKFQTTTRAQYIQQVIENGYTKLSGKSVTFSILMSNGTIYSCSGTVPTTIPESGSINIGSAITATGFTATSIYLKSTGYVFAQIGCNTNTTLNIRAVKLEIGSISTIAMDTFPDYTLELLKCQRYLYIMRNRAGYPFVIGMAISTNNIRIPIKLPVEMRVVPTLSHSSLSEIVATRTTMANGISPTSITVSGAINKDGVCLEFIKINGFETSVPYLVGFNTEGANIQLSAELTLS